jgi:hypothetical protein
MSDYVKISRLRTQFDGIMNALRSDEDCQRTFLNNMGSAVDIKDDLAEDLHFLVDCIAGHPDKDMCFTEQELQQARKINQIFERYSRTEYREFWQFGQSKYASEWNKIGQIASQSG